MAVDNTKGTKLDSRMERVISALLTEPTILLASQKADVGEHTIYRWLNNPDFDKAYKKAKSQIVRHAITQIQQATGEAVQVLREIMNNIETPASSRVSSAKTIIEQAIKAVELEELVKRVEDLEQIIEKKGA
jgi:hypothetical protein